LRNKNFVYWNNADVNNKHCNNATILASYKPLNHQSSTTTTSAGKRTVKLQWKNQRVLREFSKKKRKEIYFIFYLLIY